MVILFIFITAALWLLPGCLCARTVLDGLPLRERLRDRRLPVILAASLLAEYVIWYRALGPLGPIGQVRALALRTVSYQGLMQWVVRASLCLLLGGVAGLAARNLRVRGGKIAVRRSRVSRGCEHAAAATLSVAAIALALVVSFAADGGRQLAIEAVCRRSRGVSEDTGYVVVKNTGAWPNAPQTVWLSTDSDDLRQYQRQRLTLAPGERVTITENADTFLSIRRSGGDTVYLSDAFGNVLDSVQLPETPTDSVYQRQGDGWELILPDAVSEAVAAPRFSAQSGFYPDTFELTITAAPDTKVYYTLDGGDPDPEDTLYTEPIRVYDRSDEPNRFRSVQNVQEDYLDKDPIGQKPVDKAFIVRAVAVDADGRRSETVTQTYFVGQSGYSDGLVISLTADSDELFGPDGIYVTGTAYDAWYAEKRAAEAEGRAFDDEMPALNYEQRGAESERVGYMTVFQDGETLFEQPVGVRVQGNTSRRYALKRFAVYSRAIYSGSGLFSVAPFGDQGSHAVVLRAGLDNAVSHAIAAGRDVAVLRTRPVRVFVNGEFWYDTFLQEKYCNTYFAQTFHVSKQNVEYIGIGTWSNTTPEERRSYEELLNFAAEHDLSDAQEYAALASMMDVQSYIDYACIQVYLGNADASERMNTCVWRTKIDEHTFYGDGRWRWALYDMDLRRKANRTEDAPTDAQINSFTAKRNENWPALLSGGVLYEALRQNDAFCRQFVLTFMDLVNTTFSEAHAAEVLTRFGSDLDYDDGFFRDRGDYMIRYLAEEFGLTGQTVPVTLTTDDPEAGTLSINTITPPLADGSWSGMYFTDYPVTLTAEPAPGRTFDHWEINGRRVNDATTSVTISGQEVIAHAVFK